MNWNCSAGDAEACALKRGLIVDRNAIAGPAVLRIEAASGPNAATVRSIEVFVNP